MKDLNARFKREGKKELKDIDDLPKDYEAPDFFLKEAENMAADLAKLYVVDPKPEPGETAGTR